MNDGERLKNSILQMAIQGKLTEQNPEDYTSKEIVKEIRRKREILIKKGKLNKRDRIKSKIIKKNNSFYDIDGKNEVCIDVEIPFEVPDNWEWVRLNDIGIYKKGPFGSSLTKSMFVHKSKDSIKVYEQKNAIKKDHTLGDYYITKEYFDSKMKGFEVFPDDILVSCAGTIGETYTLPNTIEKGIINQALMKMNISDLISKEYFLL